MLQYLKNRLTEKESLVGLGGFALGAAVYLFPQYALLLNTIGMIFGVGVAAVPTSKPLY